MKYEDDPRFCGYYFEDSYVLSVHVGVSQVVFELLVVWTEKHPDYHPPSPGEQYCYGRSHLWFKNASEIEYAPSGRAPSWDANDHWDYGNIDSFVIDPPHGYTLDGEWGRLKLNALNAFVKDIGL
ncbi:MAG TPA: hypothetical protein VIA98_12465 [Allosphingosinicella sp.]